MSATEIARLGKRLGVRQQAMVTAQLYIRRFYLKVEIRRTNPYLVIATAVYLACKMEECPHHIRLVVSEGRSLWPGTSQSTRTMHIINCSAQISSVAILQNLASASSSSYQRWALKWSSTTRTGASRHYKASSRSLKKNRLLLGQSSTITTWPTCLFCLHRTSSPSHQSFSPLYFVQTQPEYNPQVAQLATWQMQHSRHLAQ